MTEKKEKMDKNIKVVGIGFFLIILAAMLIFVRQHPLDSSKESGIQSDADDKNVARRSISSEELSGKILRDPDLAIIDIRSKAEFDREHIQNSKNVQIEALDFLEKGTTYVFVHDESSVEKLAALEEILTEKGIEDYFYLSGGFLAWKSGYNPTVSEGDPQSFTDNAKVSYISVEDLNKAFNTDKNLYVIDLRPARQFSEGHLKDAVNIPLADLESREDSIPPGRKIILYGEDTLTAFKGAVRLYDLGTFGSRALTDGFAAWKEKGLEVVK